MERDATHCQFLKLLCKEMPRIARGWERYVKGCHVLPEGWKMLENVGKT
jgi:hypothetical protein